MRPKRLAARVVVVLLLAAVAAGLAAYWTSSNACDDPARATPVHPMTAVVYCDYGSAEVLRFAAVEKPVPGDNQVLVRVRAAAVNPLDWHYMRGTPYLGRIAFGLRKPKVIQLGVDFAGTIEAVGGSVTELEPGDDVFGSRTGAFAEYLTVRATAVARKPSTVTFEEAASVPVAGLTALQGLRDRGQLQPGQRVLINGASGGVGTFAVQIAKSLGANVTGVCSTRNVDLVRSLGADAVIDYTREDYTRSGEQYDVIMDNVGNRSLTDNRRVLKPEGKYVLIGGGGPDDHRWVGPLGKVVAASALSMFVKHDMRMFISELKRADLVTLSGLIDAGTVTPVIDRRYTFRETPDAIRYLEQGRARGKVVITMEELADSPGLTDTP